MNNLAWLMSHIERVLPEGGNWCTLDKAQTLASIVVAHRPRLIVELGVWMGGSFVPMLLAAHEVAESTKRAMRMVAIDAWSPAASAQGQHGDNATWWSSVDHDLAFDKFTKRIQPIVENSLVTVEVARVASDDYDTSKLADVDLLHVDGNHGEQALRDVKRFAHKVTAGGIAILDDVNWEGGHVSAAVEYCQAIGLEIMYPLGTGVVMQQRHSTR